jgi:hypothetical protein
MSSAIKTHCLSNSIHSFHSEGDRLYDSNDTTQTVNPNKISYFIHPTTNKRCDVVGSPITKKCACGKHDTVQYTLSNNQNAYYCETLHYWVFSSINVDASTVLFH